MGVFPVMKNLELAFVKQPTAGETGQTQKCEEAWPFIMPKICSRAKISAQVLSFLL